jgi:hypothetical protein
MAFLPLATDAAPSSIRDFVRRHVDMQLADVHAMLRLPLDALEGMEGGCNFASVSVLCAVVAGASTIFFRQQGAARPRFRDVLTLFYPWEEQPKGGVQPAIAVNAIYDEYRNPLAHALAVSTRTQGRGSGQTIVVDTRVRPLAVIKRALTEDAVMALEQPDGPPPSWLTPVVVGNRGGGLDIYPHSLYWGTRRMLERLFRDTALMQQTVEWFAPLAGDQGTR